MAASTKMKINEGTKHLAKKLKIELKMEQHADLSASDHKKNFHTELLCHLISPAKSEIVSSF